MTMESAHAGSLAGGGFSWGSARRRSTVVGRRLLTRPELPVLLAVAATLNLWNLHINGWANTYYSAAIRSMVSSWHNFLFASLDQSGLMTVDKPPLALWVQALSARIFGVHPLSVLVPQALMGVAAVGLLYDLTSRRFGRVAGFAAGLVLATTPIVVALSRHNNPDELLVLCSVASLWCLVRALDTGATRWLVLSAACVGLAFETKMLVAFMIVPGMAAAYLWTAPRGRRAAVRQLLAGGAALVAVGGAWPLLVTLTPASDRPWIAGTSDNSAWSLIFGYNGVGRVAGQTGGPAGAGPGGAGGPGGSVFGGPTGVLRLLQSGLGDQAGWLLGGALVVAVALLVVTRLRRRDARTGWLIAVGGAFAVSAVVFSFARGIFHPYYVSFLAPYTAALVGAGIGLATPRGLGGAGGGRVLRIVGPLAVLAAVACEFAVLHELTGELGWAPAVLGATVALAAALAFRLSPRLRLLFVGVAAAGLLAAPTAWALDTLGHATSSTFPAGGPASASRFGGPGTGAPAGRLGRPGALAGNPSPGNPSPGALAGPPPPGALAQRGSGRGPGGVFGGGARSLSAAIAYARAHGGGTIGVESQSDAAAAILAADADVAGLGGFSGRESSISVRWLAEAVAAGRLRFVVTGAGAGPRLGGDTRTGSSAAFSAVTRACAKVTLGDAAADGSTAFGGALANATVMYDCGGRAAALLRASA